MNTNYFLDCVSGNVFGTKKSPGIPAEYYIGLSTSAPSADGNGVSEPSTSSGYTRVKLTDLSAPSNGQITNQSAISFPESTASWGVVTHYVIYDAQTVDSGNLLMYGALPSERSVEEATIVMIKNGYLKLSVLNPTA